MTTPWTQHRDERLNAEYTKIPSWAQLQQWLEDATEEGDDRDFYGYVIMDVLRYVQTITVDDAAIRNAMYEALRERDTDDEQP